MTVIATTSVGFLVGLVYFRGLWRSVRRIARSKRSQPVFDAGKALRMGLFSLAVAVLMKVTGIYALGVLPGFWLARWSMIRSLEVRHG